MKKDSNLITQGQEGGLPRSACNRNKLRRQLLFARFASLVFRHRSRFYNSLTRRLIENGIAQKLFGCPGWRIATQVFVEPLDVCGVVERHLVPAWPMSRVRVDDQP